MKGKPNRYRGLTIYAICMNVMIFVSIQLCKGSSMEEGNVRTLSRRRRYLIFPEGSSLQIVYDTYYPVVDYTNLLLVGITGALAWELPSEPVKPEEEFKKINKKNGSRSVPNDDDVDEVEINYNNGNTSVAKPSTATYHNYYGGDDKLQSDLLAMKSMNAAHTISNFTDALINGKSSSTRKIICPASCEHSRHCHRHHSIQSGFRKRNTLEHAAAAAPATTTTADDIIHTKLHRSSRYKLYEHLEKFIDAAGHDGKDCILKALCETGQIKRNERHRSSFLGELMRAIFSLPGLQLQDDNFSNELYATAYKETKDCTTAYGKCSQLIWKTPFH